MNRLWIIAAIVAALVVGAVALNRDTRTVDDSALLLPALGEQLNAVTRLRIQGADDTVTLVREDGDWRVGERDYPAKLGEVRKTLIALAEATVFEPKTSNPALYDRLGVQDFGTGANDNTQVLLWAGETQLSGLLVGGGTAAGHRRGHERLGHYLEPGAAVPERGEDAAPAPEERLPLLAEHVAPAPQVQRLRL